MALSDKTLICVECGSEFTFAVSEQEFFASRGFTNEPKRCLNCRYTRRNQRREESSPREMYPVTCAECGIETTVPFEPKGTRPVYCHECFLKQKPGES